MIEDLMLHGSVARPRCRRHVEHDTPIVPRAVAEAVWEEACVWLGESLPREWIGRLAIRADVAYSRNRHFHRTLRRAGDAGRDWLWAFTRHWLAAMIRRRDSRLFARLPSAYCTGAGLPAIVAAGAVSVSLEQTPGKRKRVSGNRRSIPSGGTPAAERAGFPGDDRN